MKKQKEKNTNLVAIIISLLSLLIIFYINFIQSYKLSVDINLIISMPIMEDEKTSISIDILMSEIESKSLSSNAEKAMSKLSFSVDSLYKTDKLKLRRILVRMFQNDSLKYLPPYTLLNEHLKKLKLINSFYVPLIITNTGSKSAHVSNIVLRIESVDSLNRKCFYQPIAEIDILKIYKNYELIKDNYLDVISDIYIGSTIAPNTACRLNLLFGMIDYASDYDIQSGPLGCGKYILTFYFLDSNNKVCFKSSTIPYEIDSIILSDYFKGEPNLKYYLCANLEKLIDK